MESRSRIKQNTIVELFQTKKSSYSYAGRQKYRNIQVWIFAHFFSTVHSIWKEWRTLPFSFLKSRKSPRVRDVLIYSKRAPVPSYAQRTPLGLFGPRWALLGGQKVWCPARVRLWPRRAAVQEARNHYSAKSSLAKHGINLSFCSCNDDNTSFS